MISKDQVATTMKIFNNSEHFKLETARLSLIPLTLTQLCKYAISDSTLESELEIKHQKRMVTENLKSTIESYLVPYISEHPNFILFATIWVIVYKKHNIAVGDIGFSAGPTEMGVIEVGYSTYGDYMNKGFMTEALSAISAWAFSQSTVNIIIAQTDKDNYPSHKVLAKNKYLPFAEADKHLWWRLDKDNTLFQTT